MIMVNKLQSITIPYDQLSSFITTLQSTNDVIKELPINIKCKIFLPADVITLNCREHQTVKFRPSGKKSINPFNRQLNRNFQPLEIVSR